MQGLDAGTWLRWLGVVSLACIIAPAVLWARERPLPSSAYDAPGAPASITASTVQLVERFAKPEGTLVSGRGTAWSRSRHVAGDDASMLLFMEGELSVTNHSTKMIEVMALTVMPIDPFRQGINVPGKPSYAIHQVKERIAPGATKTVRWQQAVDVPQMYEVVLLVTAARFADGSVWSAPRDYVQELFFP